MNDEDRQLIEVAEGCLSTPERLALYEEASKVESGCIVEIGALFGASTIALALGSQAGAGVDVYSIDPHIDQPDSTCADVHYTRQSRQKWAWTVSRAGCADIVSPIFLKSSKMLPKAIGETIGLLFIDGDHKHPQPRRDAQWFEPWVKKDGAIILDDTDQEGPGHACQWLEMKGWEVTDSNSKLAVMRKRP